MRCPTPRRQGSFVLVELRGEGRRPDTLPRSKRSRTYSRRVERSPTHAVTHRPNQPMSWSTPRPMNIPPMDGCPAGDVREARDGSPKRADVADRRCGPVHRWWTARTTRRTATRTRYPCRMRLSATRPVQQGADVKHQRPGDSEVCDLEVSQYCPAMYSHRRISPSIGARNQV